MNQIIIFMKAPVAGHVKTRLCPPLSAEQAAKLAAAFARDTLDLAENVPGAAVEVAYEPGDGFAGIGWLRAQPPVPHFPQKGRDLGERLGRAFKRAFSAGARKAAAIGSDTPHLSPALIESAFSFLDRKDLALGPAQDGGYYLIALKRDRSELFSGIPWSTNRVFSETMKRAKRLNLSVATLPPSADIDTFPDLEHLARMIEISDAVSCPATRRALKRIQMSGLKDEKRAI